MIPVHKMSSESHCWKKEIDTVKNSVHSPLFFRKIVEIERYVLRAAILHECQNYLGGGSGLGEASPPPNSYNPRRPPPRYICTTKIPVTVRRSISKRSHEKIGDCEQSMSKTNAH